MICTDFEVSQGKVQLCQASFIRAYAGDLIRFKGVLKSIKINLKINLSNR